MRLADFSLTLPKGMLRGPIQGRGVPAPHVEAHGGAAGKRWVSEQSTSMSQQLPEDRSGAGLC